MDGARHRAILRREVIEQAEEEGQIARLDPPFIHGEDEPRTVSVAVAVTAARFDQPVAVRYALGDALGRDQLANIVVRDQSGQILCAEMRIDRHAAPQSTRSVAAEV